jgi:twitching motility protein PilT
MTSFASAMKYALRQRPDIILFGEARDPEGIRNAIALAETGHLVMTTIHSRSAIQTVNKIISMFPADEQSQVREQLSSTMAAIIVQKLAKRVGGGMFPVQEILLNVTAVENIIRENKLNQLNNAIYTNRQL